MADIDQEAAATFDELRTVIENGNHTLVEVTRRSDSSTVTLICAVARSFGAHGITTTLSPLAELVSREGWPDDYEPPPPAP